MPASNGARSLASNNCPASSLFKVHRDSFWTHPSLEVNPPEQALGVMRDSGHGRMAGQRIGGSDSSNGWDGSNLDHGKIPRMINYSDFWCFEGGLISMQTEADLLNIPRAT